jgi:hypothetical protein
VFLNSFCVLIKNSCQFLTAPHFSIECIRVEQWVKRGYAAISIAVEGQTDEKMKPEFREREELDGMAKEDFHDPLMEVSKTLDSSDNNPHNKNPSYWVQHSHPGPRRPDAAFGDFDEALENQWMYHCVADTILANSLMRSLSGQVDPLRIGLTGISWGGVITSTVAGLDTRFSHIIPVYGCGNLGHAESYLGRGIKGHIQYYEKVWDACLYLPHATMPSLWISWPEDPHFPMINLKHSYESMGIGISDGEKMDNVMVSLIPGLQHGHAVGWRRAESYTFAKYVWDKTKNGGATAKTGWCKQISGDAIHRGGLTMAQVKFSSSLLSFHKAEVIWTQDNEDVQADARRWQASPAILKSSATPHLWAAEAPLPPAAEAWIINLYSGQDKNTGLVVTSTYQDLKLFAFAVEIKAEDAPVPAKKRGWLW